MPGAIGYGIGWVFLYIFVGMRVYTRVHVCELWRAQRTSQNVTYVHSTNGNNRIVDNPPSQNKNDDDK